jgi:hypothetical protein
MVPRAGVENRMSRRFAEKSGEIRGSGVNFLFSAPPPQCFSFSHVGAYASHLHLADQKKAHGAFNRYISSSITSARSLVI